MRGCPGGAGEVLFVDDVVYHAEDRLEGQERDNDQANDRVVRVDLFLLAPAHNLSSTGLHGLPSVSEMAKQQYKCRDWMISQSQRHIRQEKISLRN